MKGIEHSESDEEDNQGGEDFEPARRPKTIRTPRIPIVDENDVCSLSSPFLPPLTHFSPGIVHC